MGIGRARDVMPSVSEEGLLFLSLIDQTTETSSTRDSSTVPIETTECNKRGMLDLIIERAFGGQGRVR
jgi:hypothetical protein